VVQVKEAEHEPFICRRPHRVHALVPRLYVISTTDR
jgi:hypothetical protein